MGGIEQVEDLLFGGARACDIEDIVVGELYDLLHQDVHDSLLHSLLVQAIGRPGIATYSTPGGMEGAPEQELEFIGIQRVTIAA